MAAFDYRQAEEIRDAFARHGCRCLFIGKSGATLLGFPDTTSDQELRSRTAAEASRLFTHGCQTRAAAIFSGLLASALALAGWV
jgi:hypothetical protein